MSLVHLAMHRQGGGGGCVSRRGAVRHAEMLRAVQTLKGHKLQSTHDSGKQCRGKEREIEKERERDRERGHWS